MEMRHMRQYYQFCRHIFIRILTVRTNQPHIHMTDIDKIYPVIVPAVDTYSATVQPYSK